jgi:transmembrane sensor
LRPKITKSEEILRRYASGEATEIEKAQVESWLSSRAEHLDYDAEQMDKDLAEPKFDFAATTRSSSPSIANPDKNIKASEEKKARILSLIKILSAAAVAIWLVVFAYNRWSVTNDNEDSITVQSNVPITPITPGKNQAILTLADGNRINLEELALGESLKEGHLEIKKEEDGLLSYYANTELSMDSDDLEKLNTITTPRGGQYRIILPDGTKVWLNAYSTLKFPAAFTSDHRTVYLEGEGYFEVAKNEQKSFFVISGNQEVKALGTAFNINSYDKHGKVKTTLIEGSVQVRDTRQTTSVEPTRLKPGQQSIFDEDGIQVTTINLAQVIDWKNGDFTFMNQSIGEILEKVARWYDVEINFSRNPDVLNTTTSFSGQIKRSVPLDQLLTVLSHAGNLDLHIEGRTIIVEKKK